MHEDQEEPKIQDAHFSDHFRKGSEGTHAISQIIESGGQEIVAFTNVDRDGTVGESGFDKKV